MKEEQVQIALKQVDGLLGKARFTEPILNREDHVVLANSMQLIRQCCVAYFVEKENGGTNIIPIRPESSDQDS